MLTLIYIHIKITPSFTWNALDVQQGHVDMPFADICIVMRLIIKIATKSDEDCKYFPFTLN